MKELTTEKMTFELINPLTGEVLQYSGLPNDVWGACEILMRQLKVIKEEAIEDARNKAVKAKQDNPTVPNTFRVETRFGDIKIELKQDPKLTYDELRDLFITAPKLVTEKTYYKLNLRPVKKEMSKLDSELGQKLKEKYNQTPITARATLEDK